jgi:ATPase
MEDIQLAGGGRLDALIRDVARDENAVLVTADYVQALVGEAEGVRTRYIRKRAKRRKLRFKRFFTEDTMSIHMKRGAPVYAKRGTPGKFSLVTIREKPCTENELKRTVREIMNATRRDVNAFVEVDEGGATVIQLGEYRIAIARPPFADGLEVTVVRPIVKRRLKDYGLSRKLMERLRARAEGVLIAGPPGSGKTTFASSLADYYSQQGKVTKTLESPRDLQVGPEITQYAPLSGSFAKTASVLLLVRPDYTVFDEIRENQDFNVFIDLRLAGVGMVGVVHSTDAISAIQRFINRTELGTAPSVIDTILLVKYGTIEKAYDVSLTVRVPTGMIGSDFTRPLVEIRDYETGRLEYEIYTFGNENIIVPIQAAKDASPVEQLAIERIAQYIKRYDKNAIIRLNGDDRAVVEVHHGAVSKLIGKDGKNISRIEKQLSIRIEVVPKE